MIQEPYLDFVGNTRASSYWTVVYPVSHATDRKSTRAVTLLSRSVSSNIWTRLNIPSPNVVGVKVQGESTVIRIFNIYSPGNSDEAIEAITTYLRQNPKEHEDHLMPVHDVVAGDFNAHHPLWDEPRNHHLFTSAAMARAQRVIDLMVDHDLEMALPKGIPMLRAMNTKNRTCPDNLFVSTSLIPNVILCDVFLEKTPVKTDHFPIKLKLEFTAERWMEEEAPDYRKTDWEQYREVLEPKLISLGPPNELYEEESLDQAIRNIERAIAETTDEVVPKTSPCPKSKRWWSPELKTKRTNVSNLGKKVKRKLNDPDHPVHEEYQQARQDYAAAIQQAKAEHWLQWLESLSANGSEMWKASKLVTNPPTDGGRKRVPELRKRDANGRERVATTNEGKSQLFYEEFFPAQNHSTYSPPPEDYDYPEPRWQYKPPTNKQVEHIFKNMKEYKASKPGQVTGEILKRCSDLIAPYVAPIYRAIILLSKYPREWACSNVPVMPKPGKGNYTDPSSWRPINTGGGALAKALDMVVAETLSWACEEFDLLPEAHLGGRARCTAPDAVLQLQSTIKKAWRGKRVATAILLDVKGAYPSVSVDWLIHECRRKGVPRKITEWLQARLTNRYVTLTFDDFRSNRFPVENGLDQGSAMSTVLWLIYFTAIIKRTTKRARTTTIVYIDDETLVVEGTSFVDTHQKIRNIFEGPEGLLAFAKQRHLIFSVAKFQLIDFPRTREDLQGQPIRLGQATLNPQPEVKLLGIIIEKDLSGKQQTAKALQKGFTWINCFRRLAKQTGGVAQPAIRKYYIAIALPRMFYGAETFLFPKRSTTKGDTVVRTLPKSTIAKFATVQRQAACIITGAMRTTASDILDFHANLLPIKYHIESLRTKAAIRLATLHQAHPLTPFVKSAERYSLAKRRSPLDELVQGQKVKPSSVEKIKTVRFSPDWEPKTSIQIAEDSQTATTEHEEDMSEIKLYTDGSGYENGVGAAAVTYKNGEEISALKFYLGSLCQHEVYDAEGVGLVLAAHSLRKLEPGILHASIYSDSQSAIQAVQTRKPRPASYIWDIFHSILEDVKQVHQGIRIKIAWIPSHEGISGNERADKMAKEAAKRNKSRRRDLPPELPAKLPKNPVSILKTYRAKMIKKIRGDWQNSPRAKRLKDIDTDKTAKSYRHLARKLTRTHSAILVQLRTGHIPLWQHLHRIGKEEAPHCLSCGGEREMVKHYLLACPTWKRQRQTLRIAIGSTPLTLRNLLARLKHLPELFDYIRSTRRFSANFPHIPDLNITREDVEEEERRLRRRQGQ